MASIDTFCEISKIYTCVWYLNNSFTKICVWSIKQEEDEEDI